jgi:conjugative transfer region protein TrbK
MRVLTARGWSTVGALLVLAAVIIATAITTAGQKSAGQAPTAAQTALANDVDRCGHSGETAESDAACRDAWRRSREQFLGVRTSGGRP